MHFPSLSLNHQREVIQLLMDNFSIAKKLNYSFLVELLLGSLSLDHVIKISMYLVFKPELWLSTC